MASPLKEEAFLRRASVLHVACPRSFMGSLCACPNTGLVSDILVHGMKARNRSIHGDVVVVELLPKNEWKGRTAALCENDSDDKALGDPPSEPMPTGEPAGGPLGFWCSVGRLFVLSRTI